MQPTSLAERDAAVAAGLLVQDLATGDAEAEPPWADAPVQPAPATRRPRGSAGSRSMLPYVLGGAFVVSLFAGGSTSAIANALLWVGIGFWAFGGGRRRPRQLPAPGTSGAALTPGARPPPLERSGDIILSTTDAPSLSVIVAPHEGHGWPAAHVSQVLLAIGHAPPPGRSELAPDVLEVVAGWQVRLDDERPRELRWQHDRPLTLDPGHDLMLLTADPLTADPALPDPVGTDPSAAEAWMVGELAPLSRHAPFVPWLHRSAGPGP